MTCLLAFDTATERLSVALQHGERVWSHEAAGGAQASAALIPAVHGLLAEAGLALRQVEAIAFGRGPGAFTGLRTACAVAQGLAFGLGCPVLPIDTLLAVAEDARAGAAGPLSVWAVLDARMDEIYAAHYDFDGQGWRTLVPPQLGSPAALNARWAAAAPSCIAGNALGVFAERLHTAGARTVPDARPTAAALLRLAPAMRARGEAVDAALALPLYVRDKVAQTTAERAEQAARVARASA